MRHLLGLAFIVVGTNAFAFGQNHITVAGLESYRPMSFDGTLNKESILCQGQGWIFSLNGVSEPNGHPSVFVLEESTKQNKLFDTLDWESTGWTHRNFSRYSTVARLDYYSKVSDYQEVKDAFNFTDLEDTSLVSFVIDSALHDISAVNVVGMIVWKNNEIGR